MTQRRRRDPPPFPHTEKPRNRFFVMTNDREDPLSGHVTKAEAWNRVTKLKASGLYHGRDPWVYRSIEDRDGNTLWEPLDAPRPPTKPKTRSRQPETMTEREKSAHMEGFFKGQGAVRTVKVLPMNLLTAGEKAAYRRGLASGKKKRIGRSITRARGAPSRSRRDPSQTTRWKVARGGPRGLVITGFTEDDVRTGRDAKVLGALRRAKLTLPRGAYVEWGWGDWVEAIVCDDSGAPRVVLRMLGS